jgi:hypothetical protein
VDADALPSKLFRKHVHDGEELEPMMYFEDAVKVVEDAPTIPAIPVEWLRNLCAIAKMETDDEIFIGWLIQTWQEEQETG